MYKCRKFIAFLGSFNNPVELLLKSSPFDPNINENYIEGKGETKEDALLDMQKNMNETMDNFWRE